VLTGETAAACNRKWDDDSVAFLQIVYATPHLDDFAHKLMAENVAALHRRNEAVIQVQIGTADRGRGNFDDSVALTQDFRIGHLLHAYIVFANPTVGSHNSSFLKRNL